MLIHKHTPNGETIIPLKSVSRARGIKGGWVVTDSTGEETTVSDSDWSLALKMVPLQTIPAVQGTYVLYPIHGEHGIILGRTTVIGWGIYADGETRPIAIDWQAVEDNHWAVQLPDGRVESNHGHQWDTADAWLAEKQAEA